MIANADALMILAGAGMGVDSGLPDFRGKEGFWKAYPMLKDKHYSFQDIANPQAFNDNLELAWGFYGHRLNLYRQIVPHQGFHLLKQWAESKPDGYFIYTSNVDGQFQKAGFDNQRIHECHGSIHHLQFLHPEENDMILSAEGYKVEVDEESLHAKNIPEYNGHTLRPNILMFNDWYWDERRTTEQHQRQQEWLKQIRGKQLVVIELGAGASIATVRHQAKMLKNYHQAKVIQINPEPDRYAHAVIAEGALSALTKIDQLLKTN
jgi:NAD-dependent SIR2 family protein deacetylase